ncbi:hypothetical protein CR205_06825 [Alteribacter lacisalsi]|uniref:SatD family (SatD) n=1 Tax=Alteribacter lacisalsi TaxID=2045244 RepID=A0A2W0HL93_9BACI|nr:hypothetical protein [Alteribacter lacisalsi]PYZ98305.1 hypothetical protein CR205_06825 [Alteribacter lacisalsi]
MEFRETAVCFAVDIKNSSKLNKTSLLSALEDCKKAANHLVKESLLVPFDIRGGDELIGAVNRVGLTREVMELIRENLSGSGLHYYLGVGIGYVENNETSVHTVNGSAVLNAIKARDEELKGGRYQGKEGSFFISSDHVPCDSLNSLYMIILEKKDQWTSKQQDVISLIEKHPEWTFEQAGKALGYKSPKSAVSYLLARSQYLKVRSIEAAFDELTDFYGIFLREREQSV